MTTKREQLEAAVQEAKNNYETIVKEQLAMYPFEDPSAWEALTLEQKGVANGVATLDSNGQVPLDQLGNAPEGSGSGEVDIDSLREKLSPENMDFILLEDHRTGTQMKVRVGNLANIRR